MVQMDPASKAGKKWTASLGSADPPFGLLIDYVHALQVERGRSATWIASATKATGRHATAVTSEVVEARDGTDACSLGYANVWPKEKPLKDEVDVLRARAEHFCHPILTAGLEADARAFLTVLSGYTKLIKLLCAAIDKQLRVGWHGAVLRSLIRFDEAMAHQRGLLCSLLALPDRLVSALPPTITIDLIESSRAQAQISSTIDSLLQANKLEQQSRRLVTSAVALSLELQSLQAQLSRPGAMLSFVLGTMTIEGCWSLFSRHLESNRIAEVALVSHIRKSLRVRLPLIFHHVRGNTNLDLKIMKRTEREAMAGTSRVDLDALSGHGGRSFPAGQLFFSA